MCIPVRCFQCSKVIGTLKLYNCIKQAKNKKHFKKIFHKFNIKRYCCRTIILTYVPVIENLKK